MAHEEHEDGVASRSIDWPKWHDVEGVEGAIGAGKAEFLAVGPADTDLVEAGLGINTDPVELAGTRGKVVNGFIAAGNGEAVHKGDRVEAAVRDAEAPDEVVDVCDMFLMWFRGKDNHGEPAGEAREGADPSCVEKGC